jgi:ATP-dependent helicase/nuclease subunit A
MDFAAFLDIEQDSTDAMMSFVTNELDRMVPELLTQEQHELVDKNKICAFFQSEVASRMAEADKRGDLFREKPFVMEHEGVLVQGIIDVFWLEDDKIVLLDYKTDRVETADELVQRYQTQLDLYAKALSNIFSVGKTMKMQTENLIYSFCFNDVIVLNKKE